MNGKEQTTPSAEMLATQSKFDQLEAQRQQEIEKGKVINKNIAAISEEMLMLRGEYRYLAGKNGDKSAVKKPELIIPKKIKKSAKKN